MSSRLAALRPSLELMPSPVAERPGLLLRDPFGYTSQVLIIPPPLVPLLRLFDGEHGEQDLVAALYRETRDASASEFARRLAETLGGNGFLENDDLARRREECHRSFARSERREAKLAGEAYPAEAVALRSLLDGWLRGVDDRTVPNGVFAIAAPHVSLEGGFRCYASAYRALPPDAGERVFVVLGTSHYGTGQRFGLTRKDFATPLGLARTEVALVDRLVQAGGEAVVLEDYCHAIEHSIEFQVIFLQQLFGPGVRVVPILCGPFVQATQGTGRPEDDPAVARFLEALAELDAREGRRLAWVLAVDLAHVGRRYGDELAARAGVGPLAQVEVRDRRRIALLLAGDPAGFWEAIRERQDDLNWCGASPLYTFLKATAPKRGALLRYEQWNIDPASVVSFAALAFGRDALRPSGEGGV
jgi:MEMO1 family protein